MNRAILIMLTIFIVIGLSSCGKDEFVLSDDTIIKTNQAENGKSVKLIFNRGEDWFHKQKIFTFNVTITPQIAIWAEDSSGNYMQTLYVTRCFAKQEWKFAKIKDDECIRTMSMPYWFNKYLAAGNKKPTIANPMADAVTGATPTGSFSLETILNSDSGIVNVFVEINKSFDHFGEYTGDRDESKFNGQPSIIYKTEINLSSDEKTFKFTPIGYGGETEKDSGLYKDLEKVKRAATMVKDITAVIN